MIRILEKKLQNDDINYFEFAGKSGDTKPTDSIATGSVFVEVDTGKVYLFNEEGAAGSKWVEVGGS